MKILSFMYKIINIHLFPNQMTCDVERKKKSFELRFKLF